MDKVYTHASREKSGYIKSLKTFLKFIAELDVLHYYTDAAYPELIPEYIETRSASDPAYPQN